MKSRTFAKCGAILGVLAFLLMLLPGRAAHALSDGVWSLNYDAPSPINALAVYNGKLYAGMGDSTIYVYDGTTWSQNFTADNGVGSVLSLAVYGDKLYAGTNYYDGGNHGRVWVYDGTTWSISQEANGTVQNYHSLAVYGDKLYAGAGDLGRIRVFDGSSWSEAFNTGQNAVMSLATYNGKLYAGTDQNGIIYVYDGTSWTENYDSSEQTIVALASYNGNLYAGTGNTGIIYVYDGTTWLQSDDSVEQQITSLAVFGDKLYAGGLTNGTIYVYDGASWAVSYDSGEYAVLALATYNNRLFAGSATNGKIFVLTPAVTRDFYLHGSGANSNPAILFLDDTAPTATTAKSKDSASVNFSGGNPWKDIGTWSAAPALSAGTLTALSDLHAWLGLKNSDDQGTKFDLRVEVYKNGTLVAGGESFCITGITRNPALAKEVGVTFGPFTPATFNGSSDMLSLKVLTRIGTNGAGGFCGGHSNAVGLRLYFDAVSRPAKFDGTF